MPINLKKTVAVFEGECAIEEAETVLEWLLDNPKGKVNLKDCAHLHTAVLQVLMAFKPAISALPTDTKVATTLQSAGVLQDA